MAISWRHLFRWCVPWWLSEGEGGAVLHSLALLKDATMMRARLALEARFPSRSPEDGLSLLGQDRLIYRGRTETSEHYAGRLIQWRSRGHRLRGTAYALLSQISEYYGGVQCRVVTARGKVYERSAATYSTSPWAWDTGIGWGRFWIVVTEPPTTRRWPKLLGAWGGRVGPTGRGYSVRYSAGVLSEDGLAIRRLVFGGHPWRPAGVRPEWLIYSPDGTIPAPNAAAPSQSWNRPRNRASKYGYYLLRR